MKINRKKKILFLKIKKINIKIKKFKKYLKITINLNNKKRNKLLIKKLYKMKKKFNLQKILIPLNKIKNKLDWQPKTSFENMIKIMVNNDLKLIQ